MLTVNLVILAGTVAADPVERLLPSGDQVTELKVSVPEKGKRLLPLMVAAWHDAVGERALEGIGKGDPVLVHGQLVRRFYRTGAGARSLTEVVATEIKKLGAEAARTGSAESEGGVEGAPSDRNENGERKSRVIRLPVSPMA